MDAFGYSRVSSLDQLQGSGLNRQAQIIRSYCKQNKLHLKRIYEEKGISGTLQNRPEFSELVSACQLEGVKIVVIESLDRLARGLQVQLHLTTWLCSKSIELISAQTGENISKALLEDPMRKALVHIQGVFAELEKELLVKRMEKGRQIIREQGHRNGKPLQLARNGNYKVEGPIYLTERMPGLLNRILELNKQKTQKVKIVKVLYEEGFKTRNNTPLSISSINRILKDNGIIKTPRIIPHFLGVQPG
jgi:DNA invertase Pin-like site-specific DNA recombinase